MSDAEQRAALALAQRLLSDHYGQSVSLTEARQLDSPKLVLRARLHDAPPGAPQAVILKEGPQLDENGASNRFWNEWAALSFLGELPGPPLAPRLLAFDRDRPLLVIEDLGQRASLQDLLMQSDPASADLALRSYARSLARLHLASQGREDSFAARQRAQGAHTPRSDGTLRLVDHAGWLRRCLADFGIDSDGWLDGALDDLCAVIHADGPWRALIHADAGPHNVLLAPDGPRLIDFEFAGFQHMLSDAVVARLAFPPSYHGRRLPAAIVETFEATYRDALAGGVAPAADDAAWQAGLSAAALHLALAKLMGAYQVYFAGRLSAGPAYDTEGEWTEQRAHHLRQRVWGFLQAARGLAVETGAHPALTAMVGQLLDSMHTAFPGIDSPTYYPVFDDNSQLIARIQAREQAAPTGKRQRLAILLFDNVEVLDFAGPFEVFSVTNELNAGQLLHVYTISATGGLVTARNGLSVNTDYGFDDAPLPDILVVPGGQGTRALLHDETVLAWLRRAEMDASVVASVCTGSLLLAQTGLLDGLEATTHHSALDLLGELAPTAIVRPDLRFTDNGAVLTAGGISAGIDMSLHLVRRLFGEDVARRTAEHMEYGEYWPPEAAA